MESKYSKPQVTIDLEEYQSLLVLQEQVKLTHLYQIVAANLFIECNKFNPGIEHILNVSLAKTGHTSILRSDGNINKLVIGPISKK